MVPEHVFGVKQPDTRRMTVVERSGFASAARRIARVCRPGLLPRRRVDERFASTRPEAHAAAGREVRARRTLESVCVPARRQARAEALSAAVTPTTTERWPSRTLGVAAPSTERVGRQRLPPTVVHALAAIASCTSVSDGRGVPSARTSPAWNPVRSASSRKPNRFTAATSGSHAAARTSAP